MKEFQMDKKVKAVPEVAPEVQEAQEKAMIDALVAKVNAAQKEFANFPQEKVDRIFKAAALAANNMRIPLAQMACLMQYSWCCSSHCL